MATYYHGNPEIQGDGLQTLILMNPGYVGYPHDPPPPPPAANSLLFFNSAAAGSFGLPHAPPSHAHQEYIPGAPFSHPTAGASQDDAAQAANQGYLPRVEYNLWSSFEPASAARETPRSHSQEGLSLTLSSQQPHPSPYGPYRGERDVAPQAPAAAVHPAGSDAVRISGGSSSPASGISNGVSGLQQSVLLSSKYLTAAQQLLDEVVNVGNYGMKTESATHRKADAQSAAIGESASASPREGSGLKPGGGAELSTVERQEIQMKKAKLVGMLDEVEQRYRQYRHQMQMVVSTFEQVAGIGSARTYTALALQTISKQFRCLKDAISGQIRSASRCLGEDDSSTGGGGSAGSRLRLVDNHLRQQRALQQLGMIQPNAWRPQRGLPERSVSILRAWLFEHFLHPYPKDADKVLLAKQTGLSRSQVSNWFINARVRLWKPMVEEMYTEEIKEQEQTPPSDQEKAAKMDSNGCNTEDSFSKAQLEAEKTSDTTDGQNSSFISVQENSNNSGRHLISIPAVSTSPSTDRGGVYGHTYAAFSPKKPRNTEAALFSPIPAGVKPEEAHDDLISSIKSSCGDDHRLQSRDGYSLLSAPASYLGGFGSYPMGEVGRFEADQFSPRFMGNAVSLTLGLPHREKLSLPGAPHGFHAVGGMGGAGDYGGGLNVQALPHAANGGYEDLGIQNRKGFAAQPLHDFVA